MIKLLACDVDGTILMPGEKKIKKEILDLLSKIVDKNIKVVIASGRSHQSLLKLFDEISDKLSYICHDGSFTVHGGKAVYRKSISPMTANEFIKRYSGMHKCIALYGEDKCYTIGGESDFCGSTGIVPIRNIYDIKEQIYKIAVYDDTSVDIKEPAPAISDIRVCRHWKGCLEYVSAYANKGVALSDMQTRLFLTKFDTAAIGNDMNDIKMFKNAKYSVSVAPEGSEPSNNAAILVKDAETFLKKIVDDEIV